MGCMSSSCHVWYRSHSVLISHADSMRGSTQSSNRCLFATKPCSLCTLGDKVNVARVVRSSERRFVCRRQPSNERSNLFTKQKDLPACTTHDGQTVQPVKYQCSAIYDRSVRVAGSYDEPGNGGLLLARVVRDAQGVQRALRNIGPHQVESYTWPVEKTVGARTIRCDAGTNSKTVFLSEGSKLNVGCLLYERGVNQRLP